MKRPGGGAGGKPVTKHTKKKRKLHSSVQMKRLKMTAISADDVINARPTRDFRSAELQPSP
jgi:hypothetical protein